MRICSQYAVYLINLTLATVPYTCAVPPSTRPRTVSPAPHNAPASAYPVWLFSVAITIAARETSIHSHPYINRFIPLRLSPRPLIDLVILKEALCLAGLESAPLMVMTLFDLLVVEDGKD